MLTLVWSSKVSQRINVLGWTHYVYLTFSGTKRPSMIIPPSGTWRGSPHGMGG